MPQVDFFMVKADEARLVEGILSRGVRLVPDLEYEGKEYEEITDPGAFARARSRTRLFFLISEAYSSCPLELREIKNGPRRGWYFIMQRNGGPSVDLLFSTVTKSGGGTRIAPGMIAYHKTYWDLIHEENRAAPKRLVALYRSLTSEIMKAGCRMRANRRTYFLLPEAKKEVDVGAELITVS